MATREERRDMFALTAMHALITKTMAFTEDLCRVAVDHADFMLAELDKKKEESECDHSLVYIDAFGRTYCKLCKKAWFTNPTPMPDKKACKHIEDVPNDGLIYCEKCGVFLRHVTRA